MHRPVFRSHLVCAIGVGLGVAATGILTAPPVLAADIVPLTRAAENGVVREAGAQRYIVIFEQAPVALYRGDRSGFQAIPRRGNGRLDMRSAQARAYAQDVAHNQEQVLAGFEQQVGRGIQVLTTMQHALNAAVVELSADEARLLAMRDGVRSVTPDYEVEQATDRGPILIQAPDVWTGTGTPNNAATRGEGIVVGILDSGINFGSPSFAATEPTSAYVHTNPFGAGTHIGTCAPAAVDAGRCNDKLIGAHDFVYVAVCTPGTPASDPCRPAAAGGTITEEPSAVDNNGHGTHTASTAAGNAVNAPYAGASYGISGVAPHANVIAYDVCYTRNSDGQGLCPGSSSANAVNQAVADGVVDALNFSIGGGTSPWVDPVSLAFLGASNAGIIVAAAAGNSTVPAVGSANHLEPWTLSVAASTHDRGSITIRIDVDAMPATPVGPQDLNATMSGSAGPLLPSDNGRQLVLSPGYAASATVANDGCLTVPGDTNTSPYTAGQFTGQFVVIRRGTCGFVEKETNAFNAGAAGVIIANNQAGVINPAGIPNIPVLSLVQTDADALRTFMLADPTPPSTLTFESVVNAATPDVMASFSNLGPATFDFIKPDVSAPGVNILAAIQGLPNAYGLNSGTSMASPHTAGAVALIRALQPTWTPAQVKSALMMTANSVMMKPDGATPSDPFNRGAGRLQLAAAARAGLILDETGAQYAAADPGLGGDPSALNLASLGHQACVATCEFKRAFRSTHSGTVTWTVSATGAIAANMVLPPNFTTGPGDLRSLTFGVNASALPQNAYTFGEVQLTPSNAALPTLHLPVAIRAATPRILVQPTQVAASLFPNATTTQPLRIENVGNPTLNWTLQTGLTTTNVINHPLTGSGQRSQVYTSFGNLGEYVAEDFPVPANMTVTSIRSNGFVLPGGTNLAGGTGVARGLDVTLWTDNGGQPASLPEIEPAAPFYSFVSPNFSPVGTPSPGITMTSNNIVFNPTTAGSPLVLPAGRYWVSMRPRLSGNGSASSAANAGWFWRISDPVGEGAAPLNIFPGIGDTAWDDIGAAGMSLQVTGSFTCGAPWVSADITNGALGLAGASDLTLTFDSTGLAVGEHRAVLCVGSNDPVTALALVPVVLTVNGVQTSPTGVGAALPATVSVTEQTLLTVDVEPGLFPTSSGLSVAANLSTIGGTAAQAFVDDGTGGDAVAGDNIFSFNATVALGTTPGAKSFPVTIADAQARSSNTNIALDVNTPTALGVSGGLAAPAATGVTQSTLLTVDVAPGTLPDSSGVVVTANLTSIGGSATQAFVDDGTGGDATAGDDVYSYTATVGAGSAVGTTSFAVSATDGQGRSANTSIDFEVLAATDPSGTGAADPASVALGGSVVLTVDTTSGTNPPSTGMAVRVDLTSIGGSATQAFVDDGSSGDAVAADGTFTFTANIPLAVTPGAKLLPATITDAQGRDANTDIALTVSAVTAPTGVGAAAPAALLNGASTLLTVQVTSGTPASTGIEVVVDLSDVSGLIDQPMYDDGTNGDVTPGDGTFSLQTAISGPAREYELRATVSDDQTRSSITVIDLEILPPASNVIFESGFEGS
jgi:subtilisin family serine protease